MGCVAPARGASRPGIKDPDEDHFGCRVEGFRD